MGGTSLDSPSERPQYREGLEHLQFLLGGYAIVEQRELARFKIWKLDNDGILSQQSAFPAFLLSLLIEIMAIPSEVLELLHELVVHVRQLEVLK